VSDRRFFSRRQRVALYLAADGRCTECGRELEPGWHADHMEPYARGGRTDVVNGQALCPECNLRKGLRMPATPRPWQRRFIAKYHANPGPDFLCVACPGAGKTKAAGFIARDLLASGEIERLFIVVPSGPLRMQWHRALAELGVLVDGSTMNDPDRKESRATAVGEMDRIQGQPTQGWVVTYQSLAMAPDLHRILNSRRRTLAILDEVHHLRIGGSWGNSADHALGPCVRRLSLSGTPFRSDGARIPFVEYDSEGWSRYADQIARDGTVTIYPRGFDYSYGAALSDKPSPVRSALFETFDGDAAWMEYGREDAQEARISDPTLNKVRRQKANKHALNAAGEWLRGALVAADRRLSMVREEGDTTAKGLVVCQDTDHAREVFDVLRRVTGRGQVVLAVSRDYSGEDTAAEARTIIEGFGSSSTRWLVAVAMVSEGVDIPQLRVGVYATTVRATLFFRQVLGRFVRWRDDLPEDVDQTAYLFIGKDPDLVAMADKVQQEVRDALLREEPDATPKKKPEDEPPEPPTLDFDSFVRSTSEAGGILLPGSGNFEHELVEKIAAESGRSVAVVAEVLSSMKRLGVGIPVQPEATVTVTVPTTSVPSYVDQINSKKSLLEKNLKQIAGWLLRRDGGEFGQVIARLKVQVYSEAGIIDYRRADLPQIERALAIARSLLERQ